MGKMNSFDSRKLRSKEQLLFESRMVSDAYKKLNNFIVEESCKALSDNFGCKDSDFFRLALNMGLNSFMLVVNGSRIEKRRLILENVNTYLSTLSVPLDCYRNFKKKLPKFIDESMKFFDILVDDDIYYLIDMYLDINKNNLKILEMPDDTGYFRYLMRSAIRKGYVIKEVDMSEFANITIDTTEKPVNVFIDYIEDYKDLNKLAINNGFSLNRIRGDHGIFENESGKITVIPQRSPLGKGLSYAIQKSIRNS